MKKPIKKTIKKRHKTERYEILIKNLKTNSVQNSEKIYPVIKKERTNLNSKKKEKPAEIK